jgi:hypothetical protein
MSLKVFGGNVTQVRAECPGAARAIHERFRRMVDIDFHRLIDAMKAYILVIRTYPENLPHCGCGMTEEEKWEASHDLALRFFSSLSSTVARILQVLSLVLGLVTRIVTRAASEALALRKWVVRALPRIRPERNPAVQVLRRTVDCVCANLSMLPNSELMLISYREIPTVLLRGMHPRLAGQPSNSGSAPVKGEPTWFAVGNASKWLISSWIR